MDPIKKHKRAMNPTSLANLKPAKPGDIRNPEGSRSHDPIKKEFKRFTNKYLRDVVELALMGRLSDLQAIVRDPEAPAIKVGVAKALADAISHGNWATLSAIVERIVGKVPDRIAHTDSNGNDVDSSITVTFVRPEKK